jgi:CubicO group peptidase (beta-lactamase class C family)
VSKHRLLTTTALLIALEEMAPPVGTAGGGFHFPAANTGSTGKEPTMAKRWLTRDIELFTGRTQIRNFRDIAAIYPVRVVQRSNKPHALPIGELTPLPQTHDFSGVQRSTAAFLEDTETTGLLVLKDGEIVHERYTAPLAPEMPWPCWSVTKSFVGTLIGMAIESALISGIDAIVSDLAPQLRGSGYDGVALRDVLTMSSGARWYENYADSHSDSRRHGQVHATGGSLDAFAATLPREWVPGTRLRYNSIDTNVLGLVLRRTTRQRLAVLLHDWLWEPLGMEHDACFMIDGEGAEWAGAGLICTLRDRARLGLLYSNGGMWRGQQIVPAWWIADAISATAPHLTCESSAAAPFGYGYHWWLHDGAAAAIGIYNQYVFVDPTRRIVIAKASANRNYGRSFDESGYRDREHMAFFAAIARRCLE